MQKLPLLMKNYSLMSLSAVLSHPTLKSGKASRGDSDIICAVLFVQLKVQTLLLREKGSEVQVKLILKSWFCDCG